MKLKLCLLLLAFVTCAAAQSEDDIPVENDNQFPPDKISEPEKNVLNEPGEIVDDITTQPSDQTTNDSTLSTTEAVTIITETPNTDITTETSTPTVAQSTTQEDVIATEDQITSETTEASVDAVDGLAVTEISTSEELVNEDVTTETNTSLIEELPSPELDVTEAIEVTTKAEPVETFSTEPTVTQAEEVQISTTELDIAVSEIDIHGEQIDDNTTDLSMAVNQDQGEIIDVVPTESSSLGEDGSSSTSAKTETDVGTSNDSATDTTDPSVAVDQDQGEPLNAAPTESSSLGEDVSFPTSANETDVSASNDPAIGIAKFSILLPGNVQQPTTEIDLKETSEVGTSTELKLDATTKTSDPLAVDEQLPTDDSDIKESTALVSSIEPVDVSTTEAIIPLAVDVELPTTVLEAKDTTEIGTSDTTLEGSVIVKNNLQTTQTNEESHMDSATVTPVSSIDPSEFSIRSNKADLEAISPLTLAEAPKGVLTPQEVDLQRIKDTKADNKVEDVSVGATTSVNKAGGIDKSVIGLIVAGMVVVVAGITIKKNWKSIKNKFSPSPRPVNGHTNHTNGIAPEEVPLQDKDVKNPSPV